MKSTQRTLLVIGGSAVLALLVVVVAVLRIQADLRQREQADRELQESEARYRELFDGAHDLIQSVGTDGRFIYVNRAWCEALGYTAEEAASLRLHEVVHPDSAQECQDIFCRLLSGEEVGRIEMVLRNKDGGKVVVAGNPVCKFVDGKPVSVRSILRDVTERRQAQRQAAEAGARLQAVFNAATEVAIIATDTEGRITVFSPGAEKMLGYEAAELVGKESPARLHVLSEVEHHGLALSRKYGRTIQGFDVFVEAARAGGHEVRDWTYVRKDGTHVPVRLAVTGLRDTDGKVSGFLGVAVDMSEQRKAEQAVREGEARVRLLLESTAEAIYGIDRMGLCTFCNPACVRILGYNNAQELLGKNMHDLIHHTRADGSAYPVTECRIFLAIRRGAGSHVDDEVLWRADGSSFPAEYWAYPMIRDDELVGAVITFLDITDRRAVERMKNEFVSIVSHELRTPLTSIRGALGLLAGGLLRSQPEKGQRMLDIAVSNTDRLVRLINDILDIERMESGKAPLEKKECDPAELMAQATETMRAMADKSQVRIECSPLSAKLTADPDRLVQVFTNLLSNAIKFSSSGGTVTFTATICEPQVVFRVRDHGRGIPEDKLEAIFERFQQVDASDSREKGGTGLGLPICRTIAQQHGGRIWAESKVGEGSTFFLALPLTVPAAVAEPVVQSPVRRVLVCDDEESDRETVRKNLEQRGYHVRAVASGKEAVAAALASPPDVILLDLLMPEMNGWQTMAALKGQPATQNIPIVIFSVLPPGELQDHEGISGWLQKPTDQDALFRSLEQVASRRRSVPSVLIVEDDLDLVRVLVGMFERRGIEVFHAGTGRAAIEISQRVEPDLLVLDLVLPEGDGFSVVNWLRRNDRLRMVPLVVYSAHDLTAEEKESLKLGHTEFLTKSRIGPAEFEEKVIGLLDAMFRQRGEGTNHGS